MQQWLPDTALVMPPVPAAGLLTVWLDILAPQGTNFVCLKIPHDMEQMTYRDIRRCGLHSYGLLPCCLCLQLQVHWYHLCHSSCVLCNVYPMSHLIISQGVERW